MVARTSFRTSWKRFPLFLRAAVATAPILAVTLYLYLESRNSERLLLEAETARQADSALMQFQGFMAVRVDALKDAGNFLVADTGSATDEDFTRYILHLLGDVPYFESLTRFDAQGRVVRDYPAARKGPGPFPPSPAPPAAAVLAKAMASREPAATGGYDLSSGEKAVTIFVPILRDDRPAGALAGTIRLTAAMRDLYGADGPDLWNLELADRSGRVIYAAAGGEAGTGFVATRHVPVADRAWKLRIWPTAALGSILHTAAPQRILVIGMLAALVVAVANFLLAQREERLGESLRESERLAADRDAARRRLSELVNGIEAVIWESDAERGAGHVCQRIRPETDRARRGAPDGGARTPGPSTCIPTTAPAPASTCTSRSVPAKRTRRNTGCSTPGGRSSGCARS